MKNRRTITFNIGDENRIVVEDINKDIIQSSIFSEPYHYILNALDHYFDALPDNRDDYLKGNDIWINNVFAFIGERGSGKTSCMRSIVHLLEDPRSSQLDNTVLKSNFYALDMIDPSFIDSESNIIGVILATLYKKFLDYSHNVNESLKFKLAESFARVQHDFCRMMTNSTIPDDDLEALSSLSAAIDLRTSMYELIDRFMKYMGKENAILLISVDDIDLHSRDAIKMAEQIRKYLVLPNVLVVMAVKLDQLAKLKRLHYSREYSDTRQTLNDKDLDEMVDRYITKLVPYNHRVYMPESTFYWDAGLHINQKDISCYQFESVRQAVPELIFRKTRYLFYNSAVKTSFIVPDNLRELRQIIRLLVDMKDYWQYDENGKVIAEEYNNKEMFKKYLFESWMMNHLDADSQKGIKELASISEAIQINATALRIIRDKFEKDKFFETKDSPISNILNSNNQVYNIAIGDVLAIIDFVERKDITLEQMHFLFMIKTIYSMRLYEFYDEYIEELNDKKELNGEMTSERVLARVLYQDMKLPNYLKLIGGRFFNTRMIVELPKGGDDPYRSNRVINLEALRALMKLCTEKPEKLMPIELRMAEVFMLCTARIFKSKHYLPLKNKDYIDSTYREYRELVYAASLTRKPKGYWDIGAFLFNIVDIERCYQRFDYGAEFIDLMNQSEASFSNSLYNGFKSLTRSGIRYMSPKDYQDYCKAHPTLLVSENTEFPVFDRYPTQLGENGAIFKWFKYKFLSGGKFANRPVLYVDGDESFTQKEVEKTVGNEISMKRNKNYHFFNRFDSVNRLAKSFEVVTEGEAQIILQEDDGFVAWLITKETLKNALLIVANYKAPTEKFNETDENGNQITVEKKGEDIFDKSITLPADYTVTCEHQFNGEDFEKQDCKVEDNTLHFDKLYPSQFKIFELQR